MVLPGNAISGYLSVLGSISYQFLSLIGVPPIRLIPAPIWETVDLYALSRVVIPLKVSPVWINRLGWLGHELLSTHGRIIIVSWTRSIESEEKVANKTIMLGKKRW